MFQNPANKDIDVYTEVLKWQKEMQSKSVDEAQIVLNSNLEKIARVSVRQFPVRLCPSFHSFLFVL